MTEQEMIDHFLRQWGDPPVTDAERRDIGEILTRMYAPGLTARERWDLFTAEAQRSPTLKKITAVNLPALAEQRMAGRSTGEFLSDLLIDADVARYVLAGSDAPSDDCDRVLFAAMQVLRDYILQHCPDQNAGRARRPNIDVDGALRRSLDDHFTEFLKKQDAKLGRPSKAAARCAAGLARGVIDEATTHYMQLVDAAGGAVPSDIKDRLAEHISALVAGVEATFHLGGGAIEVSDAADAQKIIALLEAAPSRYEVGVIIEAVANGPLLDDERVEDAVAAALKRVAAPAKYTLH